MTSIQVEFRDLSRLTGDPKYERAVNKVAVTLATGKDKPVMPRLRG